MSAFTRLLDRLRATRSIGLMGVVNVTPDSFSDGGRYVDAEDAKSRVDEVLDEGADVVDLGAESTRPGAIPVPAQTQVARLDEVIDHAVGTRSAIVSVDTSDPEVASFALSRGASVINDVTCLARDDLARVVSAAGASLVLMHARGAMHDMIGYSSTPPDAYEDVVRDVRREWERARDRALDAGLLAQNILFDPGLGFMKNAEQSAALVRNLAEFRGLAPAIVVGPSRKSFLAKIAAATSSEGEPSPQDRLGGTIAACLACADRGATMLRVHDVFAVRQALAVHRALERLQYA